MKRVKIRFKKIFLALIAVMVLPLVTILSGCGATPSGDLLGVVFKTQKYDEATGLPLFEVDKDVTVDLSEKVWTYPSSASGYKVYFDPIDKGTAENSSRYTFKDGKITVNSRDFEDVRYKVRVGDYSDTCIIRLKEYPVEIYPDETSMVVSSYEIVPINVRAKFVNTAGVESYRNITESEYEFLVETSDETIVNIPNENRLKFCPVRNGASEAEITVTLLTGKLDENGNRVKSNLSFKISVQVIQNISTSFLTMSGVDTFIENGDTANVDYNELEIESGFKKIDFTIYPVNVGNLLVENEFTYTIYISSKKFAKISDDGKYILLDSSVENNYELKVTIIVTDLSMGDSSAFAIDLNLIINR